MIRGRYFILILIFVTIASRPALFQERPLSFDEISTSMRQGARINVIQDKIRTNGVTFDLSPEQVAVLNQLGGSRYSSDDLDELITVIKVYVRKAEVRIDCKPVDCDVVI